MKHVTSDDVIHIPTAERFLTEDAEALRLEDALQRREVDDEQLAHDGRQDGVTKRPVTAQTHLMDHTGLRTTTHQSTGSRDQPVTSDWSDQAGHVTAASMWLHHGRVFTCERELRALNMSKKTKQVKVMVVSRGVITLSCN